LEASARYQAEPDAAQTALPSELQKHWQAEISGGYHMEYGFSCMGYELAAGLGVKMAAPECEVIVMVGDGSYLMLNSEIATSVMLGCKLIVVVLDNHGYGCINRLQQETGGAPFNNLWKDCQQVVVPLSIDFAAHARSLGAIAEKVDKVGELSEALTLARKSDRTLAISSFQSVSSYALPVFDSQHLRGAVMPIYHLGLNNGFEVHLAPVLVRVLEKRFERIRIGKHFADCFRTLG
jgi:TPP-dependent trihydroxycyclohexane-1,2-dione (THcHDO) dehydratase